MTSVWRLRWGMNGLEHTTEWTIHYDIVRELYDNYRENWPGADMKMESGKVESVSEISVLDFG